MKLKNLSDRVVVEAIEAFYEQTSRFVGVVSRVVANHEISLLRRPRRVGISEFQYFFAVDLYELFDFARGRREMSAKYVEEKCDTIMQLLHTTISGQTVEPDWAEFVATPLGLCIAACGARISLRRPGGVMSAAEVMLLGDWSEKYLLHSGLRPIGTGSPASEGGAEDADDRGGNEADDEGAALDAADASADDPADEVRFVSSAVRRAFEEAGVPV